MKKLIIALTALFTMTVSANAMSYEQARDQALFLTDKMAYELNLTEDQYEAAYEINLDYLLSIDNYDDLYGTYWTRRNLDLSYILLDWQYRAYCAANYFYRPLYWDGGYWHFGIYARYPHRSYFYFGRPNFYWSYRGGHSWRMNGGRSWYHGRVYGNVHRSAVNHRGFGMRNGFDRGDFRNHSGNYNHSNSGRSIDRRSSTYRGNSRFGNSGVNRSTRDIDRNTRSIERNTRSIERNTRSIERNNNAVNRSSGNYRGSRSSGSFNRSSSSRSNNFSSRHSSTRETVGTRSYSGSSSRSSVGRSTSRGSFSTPNRTFSPSRSSSSRSSAPTRSGGSSFGGGSHSSHSGGHSSGGHFGGHR